MEEGPGADSGSPKSSGTNPPHQLCDTPGNGYSSTNESPNVKDHGSADRKLVSETLGRDVAEDDEVEEGLKNSHDSQEFWSNVAGLQSRSKFYRDALARVQTGLSGGMRGDDKCFEEYLALLDAYSIVEREDVEQSQLRTKKCMEVGFFCDLLALTLAHVWCSSTICVYLSLTAVCRIVAVQID